eukprot:scaffold119148_cov32-Tisochrysis_lutea.AAC.2
MKKAAVRRLNAILQQRIAPARVAMCAHQVGEHAQLEGEHEGAKGVEAELGVRVDVPSRERQRGHQSHARRGGHGRKHLLGAERNVLALIRVR